MNPREQEFTVACLFAGVGGFCRAFTKEGFIPVWANELDSFACQTFRHNYPKAKLFEKSIEDLSTVRDELEQIDVLTGGFPCQPFSVAGRKKGFRDPRGRLFFEITRILKEFGSRRPKVVVLENVRNLLSHDKGRTFAKLRDELQQAGYWFFPDSYGILNTKEHTEIPQNRERVYMVAVSTAWFDWNNFRFPDPLDERRSVRDYLDLDRKQDDWFYFTKESQYLPLFEEEMDRGGKDSVYLLRRNYVRENKSDDVFTLMANMGEGGHNVPVIRDSWGIRKLTPYECARLQGFDDDFSFPEGLSNYQRYRQIGNTVTVSLVQRLAAESMHILQQAN